MREYLLEIVLLFIHVGIWHRRSLGVPAGHVPPNFQDI